MPPAVTIIAIGLGLVSIGFIAATIVLAVQKTNLENDVEKLQQELNDIKKMGQQQLHLQQQMILQHQSVQLLLNLKLTIVYPVILYQLAMIYICIQIYKLKNFQAVTKF